MSVNIIAASLLVEFSDIWAQRNCVGLGDKFLYVLKHGKNPP